MGLSAASPVLTHAMASTIFQIFHTGLWMASSIERLPVEAARRITLRLHPAWLANVLSTSRTLRRLFAPAESELPFVRNHLQKYEHQQHSKRPPVQAVSDVPFRRLPDVYAVAWLTRFCDRLANCKKTKAVRNVMQSVALGFPDLVFDYQLYFTHGPHHPVAWMERIVLKALKVVPVKLQQDFELFINLAVLFDSVAVVEATFRNLFPTEMKSEGSAVGAAEVVASASMDCEGWDPLESDKKRQLRLAWCMAFTANGAAQKGALHVLDYALQHPLVPVAFSFSRANRYGSDDPTDPDTREFLINGASRKGHLHLVHNLLGNPLPLAPPPDSRPLRPGNLSAGANDRKLQPSFKTRVGTKSVLLSRENPVARLTYTGYDNEPPLQNLLSFRDLDPLPAATYLLDQGAPPGPISGATSSPLHRAAENGYPGIVRLLVKWKADVDELAEGLTPLHSAAGRNNVASALELLECRADLEAGIELTGNENFDYRNDNDDEELGWTPLKVALERRSDDVARVLVRAGARLLITGGYRPDEHIDEDDLNEMLE
ncbi:hypothetical protein HDU96_006002 [Phlyctochytrium bullatum]|nr:hypothetical protein HDU96_006002 [Phlyctochytrium bullatum]